MKIAVFHELNKGGARRAANEFSNYIKKNNTVDLYIVDEKEREQEKEFFTNVSFFKFIPKRWTGKNWKAKLYKDTIELINLYRLHKKIALIINSKNYDVVIVNGSKYTQAPFILRFLKTKKIYYCQEPLRMVYEDILDNTEDLDIFRKNYERLNRTIRKRIDRKNIFKSDLILSNSKYTQDNIRKAYGLSSKVCYMGVDEKIFFPKKILKKSTDILFIGAYDFVDGYKLLEDALKLIKDKLIVKILASEVKWVDNDKTLQGLYSEARIALCLAYNEPFGLIPLEAMACGTPVIAINEGGYRESVLNKVSGYLIKRDPKKLADMIAYLLKNNDRLSSLSNNTRSYIVKNWTWKLRAKQLEGIIKNFIKKKHD